MNDDRVYRHTEEAPTTGSEGDHELLEAVTAHVQARTPLLAPDEFDEVGRARVVGGAAKRRRFGLLRR